MSCWLEQSQSIKEIYVHSFAVKMYKISNNLPPEFIKELMVELDTPYQTRSGYKIDLDQDGNVKECSKKSNYRIGQVKTTTCGLESIRYLGPKIWKLVPDDFKIMKTTEAFKNELKSFSFENCPCNICRTYVKGVGYIN